MDDRAFELIPEATALEAAPGFTPGGDGVPAPSPGQSPFAYLEALISGSHDTDAQGFLASALPAREAVWWASRCVREAMGPEPSPEAEHAIKLAEAWVVSPGDVNRRRAMPAAEAVGFGHPAGCLALAVFLSGGSLSPANLQEVPPPDRAFARSVAGSILLAATMADPLAIAARHRRFIELGLAVARGEERWPPSR